jgi:polysaccharide pyruvyl transferase WcaK-like protein
MGRKIGLLNHMSGGNLGDSATQDAVIQNIMSRWLDSEIFGFSMNPTDTRSRHGIVSYPIRTTTWPWPDEPRATVSVTGNTRVKAASWWVLARRSRGGKVPLLFRFLKAIKNVTFTTPAKLLYRASRVVKEISFLGNSFQILRSFDVLIISGGGQLLDACGGPWKFPYTIFKWTVLSKLSGAKCYFLNVGAGPLDHRLGKWFVKSALRLADHVSFRDDDSRALVEDAGFTGKSRVSVDCVYALDACAPPIERAVGLEGRVVGLAPMAYCDPRIYWLKDKAVYDGLIRTLASFGVWLSHNHYRLALFSSDTVFDSRSIEDVSAALTASDGGLQSSIVDHEQITRVHELLSLMASMDYVVTCRFHGVVFAHLLNKPVLALSHHPKVSTLMTNLGLASYCLDIRGCDVNKLRETFLSLVANSDEIRRCMATRLVSYKKVLSIQFDQLFPAGTRA